MPFRQIFQIKTTDINYTFSGGIGYSWIKADEIVYDQDNRISHLIWKSQMPVLSGKITADIGSDPYIFRKLEGRSDWERKFTRL
ncbi:omptin family outer membrane protease [Ochrobactrum anthropi ATCC 49188]|nr:omptin family outer membrane protease [Brucella anthropi ATCC 49188]